MSNYLLGLKKTFVKRNILCSKYSNKLLVTNDRYSNKFLDKYVTMPSNFRRQIFAAFVRMIAVNTLLNALVSPLELITLYLPR